MGITRSRFRSILNPSLVQEWSIQDSKVVIEQVADEGAAIQAKRLSTLLHLFKNVMIEADASSDGGNGSVVLGHVCAVMENWTTWGRESPHPVVSDTGSPIRRISVTKMPTGISSCRRVHCDRRRVYIGSRPTLRVARKEGSAHYLENEKCISHLITLTHWRHGVETAILHERLQLGDGI